MEDNKSPVDSDDLTIDALCIDTGQFVEVPIDDPKIVYHIKEGIYYWSKSKYLNICVNDDCHSILSVWEKKIPFNVWFSDMNALMKNHNLPISICTNCASKHANVVKCAACGTDVPSDVGVWRTNQIYDQNHTKHLVCATCAYTHWPDIITCICGSKVHEFDTITLLHPYSMLLELGVKDHPNFEDLLIYLSSIHYQKTHDISYCNFVSDTDGSDYPVYDSLLLTIQKGCKSCVDPNGVTTLQANEKWLNIFRSSYENIASLLKDVKFTPSIFNTSYSLAINTFGPNAQTLVHIKNPGKIGYTTNYNALF